MIIKPPFFYYWRSKGNNLWFLTRNWESIIIKSGIKNSPEVILKLSSNVSGDSNDEDNSPHKLLLTNT